MAQLTRAVFLPLFTLALVKVSPTVARSCSHFVEGYKEGVKLALSLVSQQSTSPQQTQPSVYFMLYPSQPGQRPFYKSDGYSGYGYHHRSGQYEDYYDYENSAYRSRNYGPMVDNRDWNAYYRQGNDGDEDVGTLYLRSKYNEFNDDVGRPYQRENYQDENAPTECADCQNYPASYGASSKYEAGNKEEKNYLGVGYIDGDRKISGDESTNGSNEGDTNANANRGDEMNEKEYDTIDNYVDNNNNYTDDKAKAIYGDGFANEDLTNAPENEDDEYEYGEDGVSDYNQSEYTYDGDTNTTNTY